MGILHSYLAIKKLLAVATLLLVSLGAHASSLSIVGGTPITFSGYNPSPNITGTYTSGYTGQLNALAAGVFSATYLGQESGYRNGFSFEDGWFRLGRALNPSSSAYQVSLNEYSAIGSTIYTDVDAGVLDFWFRDSKGGWVGNDGSFYKKASFAILAGQCITSYGCFDYILGFNDSYIGDADYDDFVVGVNLSPVPLPAAVWLFGSALIGFMFVSNRRRV